MAGNVGMVGNGNSNGEHGGLTIDTRNVGSKNKISSNGRPTIDRPVTTAAAAVKC